MVKVNPLRHSSQFSYQRDFPAAQPRFCRMGTLPGLPNRFEAHQLFVHTKNLMVPFNKIACGWKTMPGLSLSEHLKLPISSPTQLPWGKMQLPTSRHPVLKVPTTTPTPRGEPHTSGAFSSVLTQQYPFCPCFFNCVIIKKREESDRGSLLL